MDSKYTPTLKFSIRKGFYYEMMCETYQMQQLSFIINPLVQHVSGIIMPIFRSARPYVIAYGFQHCKR